VARPQTLERRWCSACCAPCCVPSCCLPPFEQRRLPAWTTHSEATPARASPAAAAGHCPAAPVAAPAAAAAAVARPSSIEPPPTAALAAASPASPVVFMSERQQLMERSVQPQHAAEGLRSNRIGHTLLRGTPRRSAGAEAQPPMAPRQFGPWNHYCGAPLWKLRPVLAPGANCTSGKILTILQPM